MSSFTFRLNLILLSSFCGDVMCIVELFVLVLTDYRVSYLFHQLLMHSGTLKMKNLSDQFG